MRSSGENDPYSISGPGLYLYIGLPEEFSGGVLKDAGVTEAVVDESTEEAEEWGWQATPAREASMLWTTVCYDPTE